MPLFDVPGWAVGAPPIAETSTGTSKKRKRPVAYEPYDLKAAEANIEKLIKNLKLPSAEAPPSAKKKTLAASDDGKTEIRKPKKTKKAKIAVAEEKTRPTPAKPIKSKKREKDHTSTEQSKRTIKKDPSVNASSQSKADGLTALQKGMKESLDGARFRIINESLYKSDSLHAHEMMKEDPRVFEDYHTGFRHQVQLWPTNPVEHYISVLSSYPNKTVVADLGCGDAAMARALVPQGLTVLSYDLVSDEAFVVEADICSKIPLPGSEPAQTEKSEGDAHVVDVVVCALSLMGTNWPNCIREAWRILKPGGELKIAEVASRFTDIEEFQSLVGLVGFRLKSKVW
ncbi:hypothetical protein H0H87_011562 [Tephrocybe sp. NHM501043]|nr:hypothetical protein H0H87_011562 [Tephrocybe sp. NHM501043]